MAALHPGNRVPSGARIESAGSGSSTTRCSMTRRLRMLDKPRTPAGRPSGLYRRCSFSLTCCRRGVYRHHRRPLPTIHPRLLRGLDHAALARGPERDARAWPRPRARPSRACARPCWIQVRGVPVFDYGDNMRRITFDEGVEDTFDFPAFRPSVRQAASSAAASARSAGSRSREPRRTSTPSRCAGEDDADMRPAPLARHGEQRIRFPGADQDLLGRARRAAPARPRVQRHGGEQRLKPIIIRPRSPGLSMAGPMAAEAVRDGSDAVSDWPISMRSSMRQ